VREESVKPAFAVSGAAARTGVGVRAGKYAFSYLLILPAVAILSLFHIFPIFYAFYISLFKWNVRKQSFVGSDNYTRALHSEEFWNAIRNTLWFVVGTVPIGLTLALILAIMLFRPIAGRTFYRVVLFLPYITPPIAMATVWAWMFQPDQGFINFFLGWFGIGKQRWLLDPHGVFEIVLGNFGIHLPTLLQGPSLALVSIMIYSLWSSIGFDTIIFLAGLSNVPREVIEAAQIDGANQWQIGTRVIAPLLKPTILFLSIISTLRAFQVINPIIAMTGISSRAVRTATITYQVFDEFFQQTRVGYGAAFAMLLFVMLFIITLVQLSIGDRGDVPRFGRRRKRAQT